MGISINHDADSYRLPMFHIALLEPEIPPNTGNIARTCAATHTPLHIVGKPVFDLSDSRVKRAGLDYWEFLQLHRHADINALEAALAPGARILCFTTKATRLYTDWEYRPGDCLLFGPETRGLPQEIRDRFADTCLKIPIFEPGVRSLNLGNSAAIALYEAIRQQGTTR